MGRWTDDGEGTVFLSPEKNLILQSRSIAGHFTDAHNADCDAYETRIAELETMLASEVADNAKLRAREVGDEVGNVLQELADANNRIAELESLNVIYKDRLDVLDRHCEDGIRIDVAALCSQLEDHREELARVKAESLRVVECGPVCELQDCITEYCFIEGKNRLNVASEFAKRNYPTMRVQPITLARWETEE